MPVDVACRKVEDLESIAQHCAVRIQIDGEEPVVFELLNRGGDNSVGVAPAEEVARYDGRWVRVPTPQGITDTEFGEITLDTAKRLAAERNGQSYNFFGGRNSNRFVFDVITQSGRRVPFAASTQIRGLAPGLCGGTLLSIGPSCSGTPAAINGIPRIVR